MQIKYFHQVLSNAALNLKAAWPTQNPNEINFVIRELDMINT